MTYEKITHIDLFSGIGGFSLAADRVFGNVEHIFCDNEPFAQEVLKKHWPAAQIYGDIRTLTYADFGASRPRDESESGGSAHTKSRTNDTGVFLLTGGFPCQPFSQAGRRKGTADDRFLWPEMARVIGEFKPTWVIAENVRGLLTIQQGVVFKQVLADLEALGYEVLPFVIPAVAVGAPHRRDRVWIVAHAINAGTGSNGGEIANERGRTSKDRGTGIRQTHREISASRTSTTDSDATDTERRRPHSEKNQQKLEGKGGSELRLKQSRNLGGNENWNQNWLEVATRLCRVDDGVPRRLDRNPRLKALGNAIVPQVAEEIMRAIKGIDV